MKGEETRQTTDQRNSPAFGAPAVPCRGLSCLAHHPIPSPAALLRLVISNEGYEGLDNVSHWTPERELEVGENNSGIKKETDEVGLRTKILGRSDDCRSRN